MSMWPKEYEDPVAHKSHFKRLRETGEFETKKTAPIKAADVEANCSVFRDELVDKFRRLFTVYTKSERAQLILREVCLQIKTTQLKKYQRAATDEQREAIVTDPREIIRRAVENASPLMSLERPTVAGVVYTVPSPISPHRAAFDGMKWIIGVCRDRGGREVRVHQGVKFQDRLAQVLIDTSEDRGPVIALKNEHHRICETNKAYSRFRRSRQ